MSAKFPEYKGLDLPNISKKILEYWEENNIFEKSVSTREGKKSFVFYEGPPSANGLPGVHHVLARAIKDIFPRYKTMKGYQVLKKILVKRFLLKIITLPAEKQLCVIQMFGMI